MFKRLFDLCMSFTALLILLPVILIVSVMIDRRLGRPILFSQVRPVFMASLLKCTNSVQ